MYTSKTSFKTTVEWNSIPGAKASEDSKQERKNASTKPRSVVMLGQSENSRKLCYIPGQPNA